MLKNDTLKNGMSRIGLYGSAPHPGYTISLYVLLFFKSLKGNLVGYLVRISLIVS